MTFTVDLWDALGVVGGLLLLAGLAWAWPPLAVIGVGVGLLTLGIYGARKWGSLQHYSAKRQPRGETPAGDGANDEV